MTELDTVERALSEIRAGRAVVVVDDEDRENEGDIIFAADLATPELLAFMVRYSSGYVCAALTGADCDRLGLPPMVASNEDARGTAYTVTVDAATGTTGISAATAPTPSDDWRIPRRPGRTSPARGTSFPSGHGEGEYSSAPDTPKLRWILPASPGCDQPVCSVRSCLKRIRPAWRAPRNYVNSVIATISP